MKSFESTAEDAGTAQILLTRIVLSACSAVKRISGADEKQMKKNRESQEGGGGT